MENLTREHFFPRTNVVYPPQQHIDQFTEEYFDTEEYVLLGLNCWLFLRRRSDERKEWGFKEMVLLAPLGLLTF